MKKISLLQIFLIMILAASCSSSKAVSRIRAEKQKDLSGYWNDNDIRIVCDSIIDDCIDSSQISRFTKKNGRLPFVKLGDIMNLSDEFIDTTIISKKFRNAIVNSGEMKFVASDREIVALRQEQLNQADHVALGKEKQIGNETGADFLLQGTVKTVIDQNENIQQKTYYVNVELYDIESSEVVWTSENSDIVKVIKKSKLRL